MKPLVLLAVLLTFLIGVVLHVEPTDAQVYKKRNADGSVSYTDQPTQGAERVEVEPAPVTEFAKSTQPTLNEQAAVTEAGNPTVVDTDALPSEFSVAITAPEQQQPIRANNGQFDVLWQSQPERLPEGYNYELVVDGQTAWQGANSTQVTLADMDRGERRIVVRIVDANGQQVARSDTVVVFVLRANVLGTQGINGGGA